MTRRPRLRTLLSLIAAVGVAVIASLMVSRRADIVNFMSSRAVYQPEQKTEYSVDQKETAFSQQKERENEPEDWRNSGHGDGNLSVSQELQELRPSPLENEGNETAVPEKQGWKLHEEDTVDDDSMAEADTQEYTLRLPAGEKYI